MIGVLMGTNLSDATIHVIEWKNRANQLLQALHSGKTKDIQGIWDDNAFLDVFGHSVDLTRK